LGDAIAVKTRALGSQARRGDWRRCAISRHLLRVAPVGRPSGAMHSFWDCRRRSASAEAGRTFRYAPLSAGLDIVRKVLGQHEGQSRPAAPKCSSAFQPSSAARLAQGLATNRQQSSMNNRHRWVGRRARAGRSRRDDTIQCRRWRRPRAQHGVVHISVDLGARRLAPAPVPSRSPSSCGSC
jgi:hypothetical protein